MTTTEKIIALFGTQGRAAKAAGTRGQSSAARWVRNDSIPHKRRVALMKAAPAYDVDPTALLDLLIGDILDEHREAMRRANK